MIAITSDFDSGNIDCVDCSDPADIRLRIRADGAADFFQWFYFDASGVGGTALSLVIENAHQASYVGGWKDYRACASYDGDTWFRVDTEFDGRELKIIHTPERDKVSYAYFAPYRYDRYQRYIERVRAENSFEHTVIGKTLDGRDIDYFQIGDGAKPFWVIARQHPGETMGSWWIEGFLSLLANDDDEDTRTLLRNARLHVIPCMNLDGGFRGHLRTNAAGIDLNRAWRNTTLEKSPEVFCVRERMQETGVSFFLDVHGDEAIPNNFLDPAYGIPAWDDDHENRFRRFSDALLATSPDFQDKDGYPKPPDGKANLDIATNYVAETWNCLSMTLEMPFKDANVNPSPAEGWSPERCREFARAHLRVMAAMSDDF